MNRIYLYLCLFLCFSINKIQAQSCAFDDFMSYQEGLDSASFKAAKKAHHATIDFYRNQNPGPYFVANPTNNSNALVGGNGCNKANYILPVVVHVMYQGTTSINASQVDNQLAVLNHAYQYAVWDTVNNQFQSTGIQFCLAKIKPDSTAFSGITYHNTGKAINTVYDLKSLMAEVSYDPTRYINIYVVEDILDASGSSSNIGGYASYPYPNFSYTYDGLVVDKDWFGDYAAVGNAVDVQSQGKVLVHEMGHYLGLYHPWQDGCSGGYTAADGCDQKGDKCCDTPPMAVFNSQCQIPPNTCYDGDTFPDPAENHMAYGTDDCRDRFTNDQVSILWSTLENKRSGLWQIENINFVQLTCCVNAIALSGDNIGCKNQQVSLNTYNYGSSATNYSWNIVNSSNTSVYSSTTASPLYSFTPSVEGKYSVILTINLASGGNVSNTFTNYLQVVDCTPLPSTQANWYFGKYAGLKFTTNGVIRDVKPSLKRLPAQIHTNEGSISMSDASGALLFYGAADTDTSSFNRFHLFDSNYIEISLNSGKTLEGHHTASQGTVVIPFGTNSTKYYIIHSIASYIGTNYNSYYKYSIIDLATKSAIKNNAPLVMPGSTGIAYTEAVSVLPKCGDSTYWLLLAKFSQSLNSTNYVLYEVTKDTIKFTSETVFNGYKPNYGSMLKFSPDGTHFTHDKGLYQFDRKTGEITLKYYDTDTDVDYVYSASFSPDSRKLYRNNIPVVGAAKTSELYQYDLEYGDVASSKRLLYSSDDFNAMMLGPDSMLYLSGFQRPYVSRIVQPNKRISQAGNECELSIGAVPLSVNGIGGVGTTSLPNNMEGKFDLDIAPDFRYAVSNCSVVSFESNQCCASSYLWNFGDGSTSTLKNPSHTYTTSGSYTVSVTTDGEIASKVIELTISTSNITISGVTSFCDSTQVYDYEVTSPNADYVYAWTITNGQLAYGQNTYKSGVIWNGSGNMAVHISNPKDGCEADISLGVTKQVGESINNTISESQVVCKENLLQPLVSAEPRTDVSYQWYKKEPSASSWTLITGATTSTYLPTGIDSILNYLLVATKGCTVQESNIVSIRVVRPSNTLVSVHPGDFKNASDWCTYGVLKDKTPNFFGLNNSLKWEISEKDIDNTFKNWADYKDAYTNSNNPRVRDSTLDFLTNSYGYKVRRIYEYDVCIDTSNTVEIKHAYVVNPLQPISLCTSASQVQLKLAYNNQDYVQVRGVWSSVNSCSDPNGIFKDSIYDNNDVAIDIDVPNGGLINWYKLVLHTNAFNENGLLNCYVGPNNSSGTKTFCVPVSVVRQAPIFTSQPPLSVSRSLGTNYLLSAELSNPVGVNYQWQMSADGGTSWLPVGSNSNSYHIAKIDKCQHNMRYRLKATNMCGSTYSNVATITVSGNWTTTNSDIWIKDGSSDIGQEPNWMIMDTNMQTQLFNSPDIRNRKTRTFGAHENPEYRTDSFNFLYVTIRNKGVAATDTTPLYLYWTLGSTAEVWQKHWLDNGSNQFNNADSAKSFPKGSRINEVAIKVPPIAAGDSITIYHSWRPPNPKWYYTLVDGTKTYTDKLSVCVLARLEECTQYPHGMTVPEIQDTFVRVNVKNNNNIATKNLRVVDDLDSNGFVGKGGWTMFPTRCDFPEVSKLKLYSDPSLLQYFDVLLTVDDLLKMGILTSNSAGLAPISGNQYFVVDTTAGFNEILLDTCVQAMYKLDFIPKIPIGDIPKNQFYAYTEQFGGAVETPQGVMIFMVDNKTWFDEANGNSTPNNQVNSLVLSPNPTPNNFTVELEPQAKQNFMGQLGSIIVADGYGYPHVVLENIDAQANTPISLQGYKAGVYNVRFEIDGQVFYKYLVKTDE
jgi:hypothetical protein